MRDVQSSPDTCTKMFDMSIQEVNGKGPKKRKKSLEICDNEQRDELNETESENRDVKNGSGPRVSRDVAGEGVELLHWRDMPQHLQFNPYVLTGYRPLQSWGGCVRSLFYFHNETINILTHGTYDFDLHYTLFNLRFCRSAAIKFRIIRSFIFYLI